MNLIAQVADDALECATVALYLEQGVQAIGASAFMLVTPEGRLVTPLVVMDASIKVRAVMYRSVEMAVVSA